MLTDILLGVILAFTVVAATLLNATLADIQRELERIVRRQDAIYDELNGDE